MSDVLASLRVDTSLWFRASLPGAFGVAVPGAAAPTTIRFHVVRKGRPWIEVAGAHERFAPGDLVLVPHGAPHTLRDAPERPSAALDRIVATLPAGADGWLEAPGEGERTRLVCGEFRFSGNHPFLSGLPALVQRRAAARENYDWIEPLLRHLERSEDADRPGAHAVDTRLCEILLIESLRDVAASAPVPALRDPSLRRALEAIHDAPERDWSLDLLARLAGQSRTVFSERFRAALGSSPMRYLASWRMQHARKLLEDPTLAIAEVGRRAGYASDSAFHRSFRQETGVSPGAFRRARLGAG